MKKNFMMIVFAFMVVFASCDGKENVKPVDEFAEIKAKLTGRWVMEYVELNDGSVYTRDYVCINDVPEHLLGWVGDFSFTYVDGVFTRYVCDNTIDVTITFLNNIQFNTNRSTSTHKYTILSTSSNQIQIRLDDKSGETNTIQSMILLNKED
jgi:hypothetical protein